MGRWDSPRKQPLNPDTPQSNYNVTDEEKARWNAKQDALKYDSEPTQNSGNVVNSGDIFTALQNATEQITTAYKKYFEGKASGLGETTAELKETQQQIATTVLQLDELNSVVQRATSFTDKRAEDALSYRNSSADSANTSKMYAEEAFNSANRVQSAIDVLTSAYDPNGEVAQAGGIPEYVEGFDSQYETMPTASASLEGKIVQYVGTTSGSYTNGYFYKCVSDGQNYSWSPKNVQEGGSGATPDITMTATVDDTSGIPNVTVTKSGTLTDPVFNLAFTGLKGKDTPSFIETSLWVNDSPTTPISGTYITHLGNISEYDFIKLRWRYSTTDDTEVEEIYPIDSFLEDYLQSGLSGRGAIVAIDEGFRYARTFSVNVSDPTDISVSISTVRKVAEQSNEYPKYAIPLEWVGMKLVSHGDLDDVNWVDLPLASGVTANVARIRRNGSTVYLEINGLRCTTTDYAKDILTEAIAEKYRPSDALIFTGMSRTSNYVQVELRIRANGTVVLITPSFATQNIMGYSLVGSWYVDGALSGEPENPQTSVLPTASLALLGKIYQYVGDTDATYTNGYFYKCISDGAAQPSYLWQRWDVQPTSGGQYDDNEYVDLSSYLTASVTKEEYYIFKAMRKGNAVSIIMRNLSFTTGASGNFVIAENLPTKYLPSDRVGYSLPMVINGNFKMEQITIIGAQANIVAASGAGTVHVDWITFSYLV